MALKSLKKFLAHNSASRTFKSSYGNNRAGGQSRYRVEHDPPKSPLFRTALTSQTSPNRSTHENKTNLIQYKPHQNGSSTPTTTIRSTPLVTRAEPKTSIRPEHKASSPTLNSPPTKKYSLDETSKVMNGHPKSVSSPKTAHPRLDGLKAGDIEASRRKYEARKREIQQENKPVENTVRTPVEDRVTINGKYVQPRKEDVKETTRTTEKRTNLEYPKLSERISVEEPNKRTIKHSDSQENPFGSTLRKVGMPVEKIGLQLGRVLDTVPVSFGIT